MEHDDEVDSGNREASATQDGRAAPSSGVVRVIESVKRHPVVVVAVAAVAAATFVITAWALVRDAADVVDRRMNPHQELYAQLEQLKLDVTPDYVDGVLGSPDSVVDPEESCDGCGELSLRIHQLEGDVTVRSLFSGSTLSMFLVTRDDPKVRPEIRWQGTPLGALGDSSFAEASNLGGGMVAPTDVALWPGAQRITYSEVFALGAPGNYEGLVLGSTSEGVFDGPLDLDAAQSFADSFASAEAPADGAEFRNASQPNTYGAFRDDGPVAVLLRDADFVAGMLVAGTYG